MKQLRKFILNILGTEGYLKLVSKIYITLVSKGLLKKSYPELFYLNTIVKPGDTCIDIGANLGYYSTRMARIVGKEGIVHAVEPVPLFYGIWERNTKKYKNVKLHPFALGAEECTVKMGMPEKNGVLHHGMTKIASTAEENYVQFFDAKMKNPDILFSNLQRLDFIKCDVEGYEYHVFSNFTETIKKHKPKVQSELGGDENRQNVVQLFHSLGYQTYLLRENKLKLATEKEIHESKTDFYFIPS